MAKKSNIDIQIQANQKIKAQMTRFVTDASHSQGQYMYRQSKIIALELQDRLNKSIDKPTPFTQRAIRAGFDKIRPDVYESRIYINSDQASYLRNILIPSKTEIKFKPTGSAKLDNYGNISGLKNGSKYAKITLKSNKQALISNGKKPKIIAVMGEIKHEQLFDYNKQARSLINKMIQRMKNR